MLSNNDINQIFKNTITIMYNYKLEKGEKFFKLYRNGLPSYICCARKDIDLEPGELLIEMNLNEIFNDRSAKIGLFMAIIDEVDNI
jgi:hypothetical protein